jgi:hypothetical protein
MQLQNNGVFITNTATGWKLFNPGIDGNLSGTAQIVTIMDSGLNTKMEHFAEDTTTAGTIGATHRKVVGYDVQGSGDQCVTAYNAADGGHGTWTSQHAVGSISNMTTNPDTTHTPNGNYDVGVLDFNAVHDPFGTGFGVKFVTQVTINFGDSIDVTMPAEEMLLLRGRWAFWQGSERPAERVEMLRKLGFKKYAYDWRAEHLPTFDRAKYAPARKREQSPIVCLGGQAGEPRSTVCLS